MTAKVIPNYPNYTITEDGVVRNVKTGRIKTNLLNLGYYYIHLWKDNVLNSRPVHRLLYQCFVLKDGEEMPEFIDHKDNNRLNNNLSNLRPATRVENNRNKSTHKNSSSGHKNIRINKSGNYGVYIKIAKNIWYRKTHPTLELAIADRDIKLVEYHGEFANNGRHIAL